MERQFRAPHIEAIVFYMIWSGQRGKFMKGEAATKSKGEGGDDDARDDRASLSSSKMIVSSMESGSKLHGHLQILHEGPWLRDNKKVRKKVELYDFK